jgi:hypothetical protein
MKYADEPETVASVYQAPEFDRLLGRAMEPADFHVLIDDEPAAASEIPSANPRIRIYEIRRE